jgi:FkbH-like protein
MTDAKAVASLRDALARHLAGGATAVAMQTARRLLELDSGVRTLRALGQALAAVDAAALGFRPARVALLSSFSIEFVHDALRAAGLASGLAVEIYQAPYGAFRQEILDPASGLYRFDPQAVILAVEAEAWLGAELRERLRAGAVGEVAEAIGTEVAALGRALRERSRAALLVHDAALPAWPAGGMADAVAESGDTAFTARLNAALAAVARSIPNVHLVGYGALVNRHGAANWYDHRMRLYARAPVAPAMYPHLAAEYLRYLRALNGLARKCLVLDLDNTLWGGIVGEDGPSGIRLGTEYPGSAFLEFQRAILELRGRGVLLAVASKNNPADVEEVFRTHPAMQLRPEHFSCMQVGWQPKAESIATIARDLNIGLEHMVFADDNPFECEQVREALPAVTILQLPAAPERYVEALNRDGWFDALALSGEDRRRSDLYRQRDQAEALRGAAGTLEDFYRDLAMEIEVAPVNAASLARAAQLTQKTNQFNVTTRRYTDADIARMSADPEWFTATVTVRDRFGDNGIVGLVLARRDGVALDVDTFLLSCRVIGRTVETAMLALLCQAAARRGLGAIRGHVIATAKNQPARDLFERHGFASEGAGGWLLQLDRRVVAMPEWFRVQGEAA